MQQNERLDFMQNDEYNLYGKFDIEKHAKTFPHYLEVVIFPDGKVEYAVPSHQEKLISIARKKKRMSRQEYLDSVPREFYFDFLNYLLRDTGCISVWNCGYAAAAMTKEQEETLKLLTTKGLMKNTKLFC